MPRRRVLDAADEMVRCPRCRGVGQVLDDSGNMTLCPLCGGQIRVTAAVAAQHAASQPKPAASDPIDFS
jgi:rRNA maturation endonuclease Nob1